MTDQPARVTPGEISTLLDQLRAIGPDTPLTERIDYFTRKADLLSRAADDLGTPEAHQIAAEAWQQVADLIHNRDRHPGTEATS